MSNALGPVVSNRIASANKVQTKPELQKRLNEQAQRKTSAGTFKTSPDGRMEFVPKLIEDAEASDRHAAVRAHNAKVLERLRAIPTQGNALKIGDRVQRVGGTINTGCFGVVDKIDDSTFHVAWESNPSGDNGWWLISAREKCFAIVSRGQSSALAQIAEPGEGDDEPVCSDDAFDLAYAATLAPLLPRDDAAKLLGMVQESYAALGMTQAELEQIMATPSFDPLTEPLDVGDYVQVVYRPPVGAEDMDRCGKRGMVVRFKNGNPLLAYDDGTKDECAGWAQRSSLLLLRKASQAAPANANTCDLHQGDLIEVVSGEHAGKQGHVLHTRHGAPVVQLSAALAVKLARVNVRLVATALPL